MQNKDQPQLIVVPEAVYRDLVLASMDIGCIPQQRIPSESFVDYVRRIPRSPKARD